MRVVRALGWVLVGTMFAGGATAAERTPRRALRASLRERFSYRVKKADVRARTVFRLSVRTDRVTPASQMALRVGDLQVAATLSDGRHRGVVAGTDLRLDARVRGGRVRLTLRAPGGSAFGNRAFSGDRLGGPVYALEAGTLLLDDDPEIVFAIAAHGRADLFERAGGDDRVRVGMSADIVLPGDAAAPPQPRLIRDRRGDPWRGRVRGHCLSQGEAPLATWRLDDGEHVLVDPLDDEALDVGPAPNGDDVRRVGPGVVALDLPTGTVAQTRFDLAVPAAVGEHELRLRAIDESGRVGRTSRAFTVADPETPTLLDAGLHVVESRGGAVWAWGENGDGEVGDGTRRVPVSPVPLGPPSGVVAVAAGSDFSLAVDGKGAVWMWGAWERTREIVPGVFETRSVGSRVPVRENGLSGIVAVAGGEDHALALDDAGRVFAWGDNTSGQLGDGTTKSRTHGKRRVTGLPEIVSIAASDYGSFALAVDGDVWAWGDSGLADVLDTTRPEIVIGLPEIRELDARGTVLCLATDGSVWTWGENGDGELGDGTTLDRPFPGLVLGLRDIEQVSAGDFHSLALRDDGVVIAWGDNGYGELGDGTTEQRRVPVIVRDLGDVTLVAAGTFASYAVTSDGALWAWGANPLEDGPIGDGGTYPQLAKRTFEPGHRPNDSFGIFFASGR